MSLQVSQDESGNKHTLALQPLSLQQTSILYVVTNLELFPPDVLALLPLKFRRELLLLLPPADIFQLEQTSFVDGIDMENEVWKVVCERYDFGVAHKAIGNSNISLLEERYFSWQIMYVRKASLSFFFKSMESISLTPHAPSHSTSMLDWLFETLQFFNESLVELIEQKSVSCSASSRLQKGLYTLLNSDSFTLNETCSKLVFPIMVPAVSHLFPSLKHISVNGGRTTQTSVYSLFGLLQSPVLETFAITELVCRDQDWMSFGRQSLVNSSYSSPLQDRDSQQHPISMLEEVAISPTLTTIKFSGVRYLPLPLVLWILEKFLYTPSNTPQTLSLTHCTIGYKQLSNETQAKIQKLNSPGSTSHTSPSNKLLTIAYTKLDEILLQVLSSLPLQALERFEFETNCESWGEVGPSHVSVFNNKKSLFLYQFKKSYDESLRHSLTPNEMKEIKTFFTFAKQLPKAAVTLKCTLSSNYMKALITCLFTEWKKIGGNTKLHKLVIQFNSLVGGSGSFKSMLESTISEYPITMMAKTVEVNAGSSIVKCNTILSYQES